MCRSIVSLRHHDEPATAEEIEAAALQFVRKISGYRKPSRANEDVFERAVADIADASARLLGALRVGARPADGAPAISAGASPTRSLSSARSG